MSGRPPYDIAAGVPVCGFVGPNGAGKTTIAAASAQARMARGRVVYSTLPIDGPWGKSRPIQSLRQLLELRDCTVFLDEVSVIFSSRSTASLPAEVVVLLQTLRHYGVDVIWTAPEWMRCDPLLRGVTQGVVNVTPLLRRRRQDDPWPSPLLVAAGLLDTTQGKADAAPTKVLRRRLIVPSRLGVWGTFDSRADTPILGRHKAGGRCVDCGGSQETPKHSQARHEALGLPWYDTDSFDALRASREDHAPVVTFQTDEAGAA